MKKIYLMRHGESEMNVSGHFAGRTDTPLTKNGRTQAKQASKQAKNLGISLIVSSPLSRALETARIIAKHIGYPEEKIEINPMLAERSYGSMEGQSFVADFDFDGITDAESTEELLLRAKEVLDEIKKKPEKTILIVSHGSLGRAIRQHASDNRYPFKDYIKIGNAEIIKLI